MEDFNSKEELIAWEFPEYDATPRSSHWYIWFGVLAAAGMIYGVVADNVLFAIIVVLFILIIFLQNWRKPQVVRFSITPEGIFLGDKFYDMFLLDEFWLVYKPPHTKLLYFKFKSNWRPLLSIPLNNANPLRIREVLANYLSENLEQRNEQFADSLSKFLKL